MFNYIKVILSFLNKNDIKKLNLLILLMVLAACIELAGVGAIFPYIRILGDQQIIQHNSILHYIFNFFHFKCNNSFLVFIGFVIFLMLSLKAIITCINNYYQSKFAQNLNIRISGFCIRSYLFMPYQKAMEFNTSTLSKYILTDVVYTVNVITFMLSIATDFIVILSLGFLILWIDFKIVLLSVASLTTILLLIMKGIKRKIKNISNENEYYVRKSYNIASDAFQGLKDIKINNVETYFIEKFVFWRRKNAENMVTYNVIANVPSVLMNLVGFGILLIILLYLLFSHRNLISILPIVGITAISIQRILPAMARISLALSNVRQYYANVLVVREALDELGEYHNVLLMKRRSQQDIEFKRELRLKNITYQYPKAKTATLKNISLAVPKNTSVGIVGASGAGKTTLVDLILGLLPVKSGSIFCDDIDITNSHMDLSHLVGYVPQHTHLLDGTLLDNIALGISEEAIDYEAVRRSVNISQLHNLINDLPEGLYTQIGEKGKKLSGGQRQRVGIARALYHDPEIIIMDEATNALDCITENEFNEALKSLMGKKTLIIIAHRHSSILFCDKLVVLREGKIVSEGSHNELVKNSEIYRTLYRLESIKN